MEVKIWISSISLALMVGCATKQEVVQHPNKTNISLQSETTQTGNLAKTQNTNSDLTKREEKLVNTIRILNQERNEFAQLQAKFERDQKLTSDLLAMREKFIKTQEEDLQKRSDQLDLREKVIHNQLTKLETQQLAAYNRTSTLPLRYIQFVATQGGNIYTELSHLGQIISEQVPDKDIYRYKVMGQFNDDEVTNIISQLKAVGYQGAFEVK